MEIEKKRDERINKIEEEGRLKLESVKDEHAAKVKISFKQTKTIFC